jgi:hypothetical protein
MLAAWRTGAALRAEQALCAPRAVERGFPGTVSAQEPVWLG